MRRVLLDENLPYRLRNVLSGLDVVTVNEAGWTGTRNGELLRVASERFDVFLTGGKNLSHQQNLSRVSLGVVVVGGYSTKIEDLLPLVPRIRDGIEHVAVGEVIVVEPR